MSHASTRTRKDSEEQAHTDEKAASALLPPDGGREAWLTILGAWMVNFCTFGYINAFGVYQDYYTRVFLTTSGASNISWIGSFQLFMMYAPGAFVGRAFDAGYFHHIMIFGSVLYVVAMFMVSLVHKDQYYQAFLAQGVAMGIGQGLLFLPALTIVSHHFRRRKALATGIVVTGASLGGIVFPIMLNKFSERFAFVDGVRASAAVVAVLLLLANCLMKARVPSSGGQRVGTEKQSTGEVLGKIMRDKAYWTSVTGAFLTNLGLFFPYFYLQLFAVRKGVSSQVAFYSLAMLNAGSIPGRLLPPFLADRLGVYNMLILSMLMSSILLFTMFAIENLTCIIIFALLFGFSSGAYVSLIPSLLVQLSTHMNELGVRMGIAFSVVAVAMLVGTPIEGALLGHDFEWPRPIVFCGICVSIGAVLMTISRSIFIKERGGIWRV